MTSLDAWPFDSGFGATSYEDRYTEQFQFIQGHGIIPSEDNTLLGAYTSDFKVYADSSGMQVKVNQGRAAIKGHFVKIADSAAPSGYITETITAADATNPRIDVVVIQLDRSGNTAVTSVKAGTPAATPAVPSLTQTATLWEFPLAEVYVGAGVTTIADGKVKDRREFAWGNPPVKATNTPMILNGDFRVWNDGTTLAAAADGTYTAEGWVWRQSGAGVVTVQQATDAPTTAKRVPLSFKAIEVDVTTADGTIGAGDYYALEYRVEGYLFEEYALRPWVLKFWHKHTITGIYSVAIINGGSDRSCVLEYEQAVGNTWEYTELVIPESPSSGGTWDYTTGVGLRIFFPLAVGSTKQAATPYSWQTGEYWATARQVNNLSSTSNFFRLSMVGDNLGQAATPYTHMSYQELEDKLSRYYEVLADGNSIRLGAGHATNTESGYIVMPYRKKRAAPSGVSVSSAGHFSVTTASGGVATCGSLSSSSAGVQSTLMVVGSVTGSPLTAGNGMTLQSSSASATLKVNARL